MAQQAESNEGAESKQNLIDVESRDNVTYGSRICLEHVKTQYRLHSHHKNYPDGNVGSKQQQITCYSNHDDNDWFIVKSYHNNVNSFGLYGKEVRNGDVIRLQHYNTGVYLHSHNIRAHMTDNYHYEVTGF